MKIQQLKLLLSDIRFWIVFFFVTRLIGITNAPLEIAHNWRQSLTNMVTRNYVENGFDFFHPMVDIAGNRTGIMGGEFPFFNWLVYLVSSVFGYEHWHGRIINLIVSSIGLYFFYKLIKGIIDKKIAFTATIILIVSIWFSFSRKIMPDTFSVSIMIIGLYYAYVYLKQGKLYAIISFFILCTLGMLCKIPALSLLSALGVIFFMNEIPLKRKIILTAVGSIGFSIVCWWYFIWVPHLVDTYDFMLFFPKTLSEGIKEISTRIPLLLERFYFSSLHSFIALAAFIVGMYFMLKSKHKELKLGILLITIVFGFFIIKTGKVFPNHSYYIVPFTPIMAIIAAFALAKLPKKLYITVLVLICIEAIANQQDDFFIKERVTYKLSLDAIADKYIPKNELVIINGGASPQDMYFAHQKGWTVENSDVVNTQFMNSLIDSGANYLIIDQTVFEHQFPNYKKLFSNEHYKIYKLTE